MPEMSDLAPLLYRSRWLQSSLAGEARSRRERPRFDGPEELTGRLSAAPGGQYRADLVDESGHREQVSCDRWAGPIPFPRLLSPAWLLAHFDLEFTGAAEYLGRPGYSLAGSRRRASRGRDGDGVTAVVDAELGVLLRYEVTDRGRRSESAEFTSLAVAAGPEAEPGSPDLSDDQVRLLCRSALGPLRLSAELREWADVPTAVRLGQAALAATDLGRRTRWLWQLDEDPPPIDRTARLQVALPGCYRIDAIADPAPEPACLACDGEHLWLVYPDRVAIRPGAPPPDGIWPVIDPAWLLDGYRLAADGTATVGGRPGLRLVADPADLLMRGPLSDTMLGVDRVEATIDLELGIALRQVCSLEGHPVLGTELSDVTAQVDRAAFRIDPAPGTRVITGGLLAEAGRSPARAAWMVARGTTGIALELGRRWAARPRP